MNKISGYLKSSAKSGYELKDDEVKKVQNIIDSLTEKCKKTYDRLSQIQRQMKQDPEYIKNQWGLIDTFRREAERDLFFPLNQLKKMSN